MNPFWEREKRAILELTLAIFALIFDKQKFSTENNIQYF